jgi:hypothetical protein
MEPLEDFIICLLEQHKTTWDLFICLLGQYWATWKLYQKFVEEVLSHMEMF